MSTADNHMPEDGDAVLAAEYVLGVLDATARRSAERRLADDRAFARLVEDWQQKLAPLNDEYEPVAPPASVKAALDKRLFAQTSAAKPGFWQSLAVWRALAAASLAALAVAVMPVLNRPATIALPPIVAPMQADSGEVRFVALYQPGADEIRLTRVKADKGADRDFELWFVDGSAKPESMGVVPDQDSVTLKIRPEMVARINAGDAFAVSVEPVGGSPTGTATGPVIAVGVSRAI